jgi:hypothetical protein
MHGLNCKDCETHPNTKEDSYIWGLANYIPKKDGNYKCGDARFVFINLTRCNDILETFGGIFHELMHHSFELHNYNLHLEEDIISWAENESHEVYQILTTTKETMSNDRQIPTALEFLHRDESGVFDEVDIVQAMDGYAKLHVERIKQFLYEEICERRPYSSSKMCEEVLKFIDQMGNK